MGENNFEIISLPNGQDIDIESFSEFETAYTYFKDSIKFKADIKAEIASSHKALLFVEGDYDIRYLSKAAELLGREDVLTHFKLIDSDGHGNISKVAQHFDSKLAEIVSQKVVLLYDCDISKPPTKKGKLYKRTMTTIDTNPIKKGVENLFPLDTLNSAKAFKTAFIDITPPIPKLQRGVTVTIPELWEVNSNEKKSLCDWIVENGTAADFSNFNLIFDILSEIIRDV